MYKAVSRSLICPHCGKLVDDNRRHKEQTGGYFAFLHHVFKSWPEADEWRPPSADMLRQWILIWCGHTEPPFYHDVINGDGMRFALAYIEHKKAQGRLIEVIENGGMIEMIEAISQKEAKMGHREFNAVAQDVFDFIKDRTGIDYEKWLELGKKRRGEQKL